MKTATLVPSFPSSSYSFKRKTKYCSEISRVGSGLSLAQGCPSKHRSASHVIKLAVDNCLHRDLHGSYTYKHSSSFQPAVEGIWVCTISRMEFSFATPIRRFVYKMLFASKACQEELLVFLCHGLKRWSDCHRPKAPAPLEKDSCHDVW